MGEIFKNSLLELYKKFFKVIVIFLLSIVIIFGINRFDVLVESFTVFVPIIIGILFIDDFKSLKWKNILINLLIYILIFSVNTYFLYKRINILQSEEFITDSKMILYNLIAVTCDVIVSIFAVGFLYSITKNLKYKIAVIDMFRYFSEKSSKLLVLFYGIIFSLFVFILVLYGLDSYICYNFLNIFFLLFVIIFVCFVMLVFKNFLISDKEDEVFYRLREKSLGFYTKYILGIIGITIGAGIIIAFYFLYANMIGNIFLLIIGGILILLLVTGVEILVLNMFIKINGRVNPKPISLEKIFKMIIINFIGAIFIGVLVFINYIIDMNFFIENILVLYFIFAIILVYFGLIINFQLVGIFIDKLFMIAFKDGFILSSKFLNPKILIILIGQSSFMVLNTINGTFTFIIYFINLIISFYLIDFYLQEKEQ